MKDEKKDLYNQEAINKLQKLTEEVRICMFCTLTSNDRSQTRPMSTIKADDQGVLWFFSSKVSHKVDELQQDHDVQLFYSHPGKDSYLTVYGKANVMYDRAKVEELWNPILKAWFPEGKDDPNLCIIRVEPQEAYYWDNEQSRMMEFLGIIAAAVTGKPGLAGSKEGKLEV